MAVNLVCLHCRIRITAFLGRDLDAIAVEEAVDLAFHSLLADRLAFLCGAGLSMAAPSNLPSAAELAALIQAKYNATVAGNPLTADIEQQADYFWARGEFETVFIRTVIDQNVFASRPNAAHFAIADFLLTNAADFAVSANVDELIETAGLMLYGMVERGVSADDMAAVAQGKAPLLKIHGCWRTDRNHTFWTREQLTTPPLQNQIPAAAEWARHRLMNRDILVVGFFTDWDYLNTILASALHAVQPANLIVVDPDDPANLQAKAPNLYAVGQTTAGRFCHVQEYGDVFLQELRTHFSRSFIRQTLHGGAVAFEAERGTAPPAHLLEPAESDPEMLWRLRRDIEGCLPNQPASLRAPPNEPQIGLALLELLNAGAHWDEALFRIGDDNFRVLRASGQFLHQVEAAYARDDAPLSAPDAVIAVGAERLGLAAHVARPTAAASIARGAKPQWFTRAEAAAEFGL
jgi:hypothetical protein